MKPRDLIKESNSANVVFHKFVLLHRKYNSDLFCFYEGKDSQYYFPRINSIEKNHHTIVCGNKKSVIISHKLIKSKYPSFRTKFFIDSDYDTNKEEKDIYITPSYSIENFYCTEKTLSNILKNEFFFTSTDNEYDTVINLFKKRQEEFHNEVALFNLWYFSAKKKSQISNTFPNISLSDKFPKGFIAFSLENISAFYDLKIIKKKFPTAIEITEADLNKYKKEFESKPPILRFRGKYEIEFFSKFLMLIIEDANKNNKIIKTKTKFRIDPALILSQISQYAETPNCLLEFLKNCA